MFILLVGTMPGYEDGHICVTVQMFLMILDGEERMYKECSSPYQLHFIPCIMFSLNNLMRIIL